MAEKRENKLRILMTATAVIGLLASVLTVLPSVAAPAFAIHVQDNALVDSSGNAIQLRGASRSGTEYKCQQGNGIFEGPVDQAAIDVMKSWQINFIRIPLNEHCWLGIENNAFTGAAYRNTILDYVSRLNANGIYVDLDLHFTEPLGPNTSGDPQRQTMANVTYSIPFWASVASTFKEHPAVIFELFNEPHGIEWPCLRYGCSQGSWDSAGTEQMTRVIRATGSLNPIIVSGIDWGHDMRWLLANLPTDPANQLIAGQHLYNFKRCVDEACWNNDFLPIAKVMPLIGIEVGQEMCSMDTVARFMNWMDANGGDGYSPWAFVPGSCPALGTNQFGSLPLISDWTGTPTSFGLTVKNHYASVAPVPQSTTTTTIPQPTTTTTTTTTTTAAPPQPTTTTTITTTTTTTTTLPEPSTTTTTTAAPQDTPSQVRTPSGYRLVTANGHVHAFGDATDLGGAPADAQIVSLATTPTHRGYWLVAADGRLFSFGDAEWFGDMRGRELNQPITGMAVAPSGLGYWLLGRDGGVFSFGAVPFYGSTGSMHLNAPVVSMTAAPDGGGYWFVASDGGIFAFGASARFFGSTGSLRLNKPVVGMAAAPDGLGYWLVASDGGIFAFGPHAPFYGSTGSMRLNKPVVGMVVSPAGDGYRFVAADGGVFAFGNAPFAGSLGANGASGPVVAIAA